MSLATFPWTPGHRSVRDGRRHTFPAIGPDDEADHGPAGEADGAPERYGKGVETAHVLASTVVDGRLGDDRAEHGAGEQSISSTDERTSAVPAAGVPLDAAQVTPCERGVTHAGATREKEHEAVRRLSGDGADREPRARTGGHSQVRLGSHDECVDRLRDDWRGDQREDEYERETRQHIRNAAFAAEMAHDRHAAR